MKRPVYRVACSTHKRIPADCRHRTRADAEACAARARDFGCQAVRVVKSRSEEG
jgi:hypothetical protein